MMRISCIQAVSAYPIESPIYPAIPIANSTSEPDAERKYKPMPEKTSNSTCGNVDGLTRLRTRSETVGATTDSSAESSISHCECASPVKSDDCPASMAKRLTKALREKRRWIGLSVSNCTGREELESKISDLAPSDDWRLMDFNGGAAILRILLKDQDKWRSVLNNPNNEIYSITTSGKIRLVRERIDKGHS